MELTLPKGETFVWVSHYDADRVLRYVTTSNRDKSRFSVFEVSGNKLTRLGSGKNPAELEQKYIHLEPLKV